MFGSWDPGTPASSGSSGSSSSSSSGGGGHDGGAHAHRPAPRSQFLRTLYSRAAAARRGLTKRPSSPAGESATSAASTGSTGSAGDGMSLATSSYSMLGSLRRGERQPTVELARPAPEVEFSRVADVMRPMLRNYVPADSPSLLSLRANQHGSDFAGSPLSQGSMGDRVAGGGLASARLPLRAASSQGGRAEQAGAAEALPPLAYFHDERDVPFRSNAVEIAAQDDKRECAFLSQERHGMGGEIGRARSILPLVVGQMQLTAAVGSEPAMSGRELVRPLASGRLLAELDAIGGLNQRARGRLADSSGLGAALPELALRHMRVIVRQLLDEIEVPVDSGWDQVILDLAANAVGRVRPNVRGGDKMDLRHYVRIKRIPGGAPRDSQYVSGIVFTKNLAHRQMPRFVAAPRIMLLTLPLEYTRQSSRYVSFDEELRMQQGFTEKLVQRIAGAAPSVVMADKPVPRQVLEGLMRNRIAVVQGVKRGVIRAVARCTGAEIVTSMDKFSSYPRTGTCEALAVQTYEHPSLPEFRKSFVFLDGCIEHLGGTIVLRGEPFGKLGDLKQVVDLVICLAYSAYLETALLLDEFALAAPGKYEPRWADPAAQGAASGSRPRHAESESLALLALSEYDLVLSSSPSVRIPPPHVLVCMREKELAIRALAEKFGQMTAGRRDAPPANGDGPAGGGCGAGGFGTGVSFLVSRQLGAASANRMRQQYESELALHESYVHEGRMFLQANPHAVSLWDYQSLAVAYMLTCRKHDYCLCVSPQYHLIPFYAGADATLGQYLEMCFNLDSDCIGESSRCVHPMYEHCHSYIHGTGRVDVTMDEYPCPIERLSEITLMWSECARCGRHTPVTCMSDETSRYSFGKYLEATFYSAPLRPRAAICDHDLHRDFVRCFTLHNMVVRFAYTELRIWNIAAPTTPLYFNMDVSIRVKDEEAAELRQKMDAYYASLASSLDEFPLDLVYKDKAEGCRHLLQSLSARAATEHVYFQQTLVQTLRNTHPADTLVLVVVYEALQGKVVEWNLQFSELARLYIQVDPSGRGAASTATKRTGDSAAPAAFAPGHEIDTLEIIDELHSAANHHYAPADVGAHASMRFAMPRLRPSPSASAADLAGLAMRAEDSVESAPQGRSRLHRRLSMEMMRQERVQLERLIERQRYAAELADGTKVKGALRAKGHAPDTHVHADADARTRQHASATAPLANADQRHARGADPSGFSTACLIQPVAADTNDAVRDPRQTQFPELRGHRGKGRLRLSGLATKGTQPLLDILHKSSAPADPAKEAGVPPTRIPGIRQQQQTQQDTQVAEPLATAGDRRSLAGSQPANARHSNIPRPPNIRSRATSPTGGEEHGRGSSNVFLRLAKRLNGARGQHGDASALGTMSRKMDLLLPATAQYMSQQQPKRPPAPQVQVFYTRPSANESPSREPTPPRRHSYQVAAEGSGGPESPHGARQPRQLHAPHPEPAADDGHAVVPGGNDHDDYRAPRYRSATVSQAQQTHPAGDLARGRSAQSQRKASATHAQVPVAREDEGELTTPKDRKPSASLRPSSLIPSLTRRLGLGFGLKSGPPANSGAKKSSESGAAGAADSGAGAAIAAVPGRRAGSRVVSSSSAKRRLHERAPIPPRLSIDSTSRAAAGATTRRQSRRLSRGEVGGIIDPWDVGDQDSPRSLATRSQSSLSEQISIDTSSDSDIDSDIDGGLVYTHSMQLTPGGAVARSYRSSHYMDGRSGKPGSEDFSESPADLLLSSPIRQMQPSTRRSQQLLSAADARDGMARAGARSMLGSLHRLHSQHRRESSAEDDELDPHEPDLHFGQSDTGSDAENASSFNNHGTGPAAVLPHTSTSATTVANTADTPADASPRSVLSAVALSAAAASGLSMTRTRTAESGVDVGGGGDSAAMVLSPPENIATFWKAISNLLMAPDTSQLFQIGLDLVYPLGPTEHVMPGSPIIVREAEPSSIIAYTLLNDEFRKILHALFEEARSGGDVGPRRRAHDADDASSAGSGESFDDDLEERSPLNEFSQAPPSRDDGEDIKRVLLQAQEHVYFEFSAGRKKFTCEVYYAAQFEALRRCNGCEDSYIESLSRCMPYSAKGGKSGSAFMLTRDRRFIAKHVSKAETKAFLKFAPSYFEHMYWNWLYRDNRPSVLAKIFGFCCVTLPNAAGGKPVKLNVMIMENLFYGRNCSPVFDLKGSERNRMVDDKGTNAVFQDENLVKFIRDRPICIRQQTKRHLHDAIWNDTLFLSKMNVMDYSLLVGFDAGSNQLVVGIIDFIRTFTWDKKLESWVKEAGILGGGKGPTIVSPKQYKNRFREAMERYFLTIPDKFYES